MVHVPVPELYAVETASILRMIIIIAVLVALYAHQGMNVMQAHVQSRPPVTGEVTPCAVSLYRSASIP
jgi:hypothetical protein